jgi:hypothetical protein
VSISLQGILTKGIRVSLRCLDYWSVALSYQSEV